ncbi:RNase H domain-containing protein [Trichonephila clavata]|uniref:RNase H domain-containing protein n=1 Tax=Trichonephila clavata TaxID=2740835 RepID=A0A8X6GRI3_TRICU|nr:RNase H domain-containing protein [Trichonephila clavata]
MIQMQCILSHMNLKCNDIADDLKKGGTSRTHIIEEPLSYLELHLKCKAIIIFSWKQPPLHPLYLNQFSEASISFKGDTIDKTTFARCVNGALKVPQILPWCQYFYNLHQV